MRDLGKAVQKKINKMIDQTIEGVQKETDDKGRSHKKTIEQMKADIAALQKSNKEKQHELRYMKQDLVEYALTYKIHFEKQEQALKLQNSQMLIKRESMQKKESMQRNRGKSFRRTNTLKRD